MSDFQSELAALRARLEENLAPPFLKVLHSSITDLERDGAHRRILPVGASVPEFTLPDQTDTPRPLSSYLAKGPLVVTFYRGFWCPYCNADLENLQRYVADLEGLGASVVAVSPELPRFSKKIIRRKKLTFDLLSDPKNDVAAMFGLRWQLSQQLIELHRDKLNVNLRLYHGNDDWSLPIPGRFVLDSSGRLAYSEAHPDYTRRPDPDDALQAVRDLCS